MEISPIYEIFSVNKLCFFNNRPEINLCIRQESHVLKSLSRIKKRTSQEGLPVFYSMLATLSILTVCSLHS